MIRLALASAEIEMASVNEIVVNIVNEGVQLRA